MRAPKKIVKTRTGEVAEKVNEFVRWFQESQEWHEEKVQLIRERALELFASNEITIDELTDDYTVIGKRKGEVFILKANMYDDSWGVVNLANSKYLNIYCEKLQALCWWLMEKEGFELFADQDNHAILNWALNLLIKEGNI